MAESMLTISTSKYVENVVAAVKKTYDYRVDTASTPADVFHLLVTRPYSFLLAEWDILGEGAVPLLRRLNRIAPQTSIILFTTTDLTDRLQGATVDYMIDKSLPLNEAVQLVFEAIRIRRLLDEAGLYGRSQNLKDVARRIIEVAPTDISVLIMGPSGSGKELVAQAIHANSPRQEREFLSINCASIPETLLESELFGYEKGAFTGADRKQIGLLEQAHTGTVFLDEIGEMHPRLQAKLLRAIETHSFIPLGARKPVSVDVRIIAATNRDLQQEVENGNFRADLYYRIGVINITLKRLAERNEDILPIIAHHLGQQKHEITFSPEATELLLQYGWPGNVRELLNFLQRLLVTKPKGEIDRPTVASLLDRHAQEDRLLPVPTGLSAEESSYRLVYQALLNLANEIAEMKKIIVERLGGKVSERSEASSEVSSAPAENLEEMEEKLIRETLQRVNGNRRRAASLLGIGERTLYRKLQRYNID